jgi:hypothetical protein
MSPTFARDSATVTSSRSPRPIAQTRRGLYIFLTVFDRESSLGLVQLYYGEFEQRLAEAAPVVEPEKPVLAENFERDLNHNLAALFGRA